MKDLKELTTDELYNIAAMVYPYEGDATGTQVGYRREGFVQGIIYALGQSTTPEVSEETRSDIARIRNYFGENDATPFEHWAFSFLDALMKQQIDDRIGCFHCGKRIDKNALYCPYCEKAT